LVWKTTVSGQMPFRFTAAAGTVPETGLGDGTSDAAADGEAAGLAAGDAAGDAAGEAIARGELATVADGAVGFGAAVGAVVGPAAGAAGPHAAIVKVRPSSSRRVRRTPPVARK
jgi:hypothetical protein